MRREQVVNKRKRIMIEKKEKTIFQINKHMIKRQEEKILREKREELKILQLRQKTWLALMSLVRASEDIKKIRNENRRIALHKIKRSLCAAKIQKMYRLKYGKISKFTILIRASHLLKLFTKNSKVFSNIKLMECVKESAKNHKLAHSFKNFNDKISLIQNTWHEYQKRKKIRWDSLVNLWNSIIEEQMLKGALNNKKKNNKDTKKFSSVTISARNTVLAQHEFESRVKFLKNLADFKESKERLIEKVINQFRRLKKQRTLQFTDDYPIYTILPSRAEMLKLIEKAIKIS